jgi:predicted secreted hydrolase
MTTTPTMVKTTKQAVQELKPERVQEEIALVAEEPYRIWLKAERVQEPTAAAIEPDANKATSAYELNLTLGPQQEVTIDVTALGTTITI